MGGVAFKFDSEIDSNLEGKYCLSDWYETTSYWNQLACDVGAIYMILDQKRVLAEEKWAWGSVQPWTELRMDSMVAPDPHAHFAHCPELCHFPATGCVCTYLEGWLK